MVPAKRKTDNPDPASFFLIDSFSVYYQEEMNGPVTIKAVNVQFMDVIYENKSMGRKAAIFLGLVPYWE